MILEKDTKLRLLIPKLFNHLAEGNLQNVIEIA